MAKKICLDAGHYGKYNQSPAVKSYYESEMNWKLHNYLGDELKTYGFEVTKTRTSQAKDLEVTARGKKSKGCDLFVSIHSNAVGSYVDESVDFATVYHLVNDTTTDLDEKSKALAEKLAPVIASTMGTKQGYRVLTRKSSNDRNGDGLMNDNYYGVLNGARIAGTPGLILEHSFHTNTKMTNWLLQDSNLKKLAVAEAKVIDDYFGMKKEEPSKTIYRVQIGAYSVKANAEKRLAEAKAKGFSDAFIAVSK